MNSRTVAAVVLFLSSPLTAQALTTFQAGQIAKATDFNANFSELDTRLSSIENARSDVTATINGVTMNVRSYTAGSYVITTPTGVVIYVDEFGYPTNGSIYYTSNDCSGTGYVTSHSLDTSLNLGESFTNPDLTNKIEVVYDDQNIYYSDSTSDYIKLNYQSNYSVYTHRCSSYPGTIIAQQVQPNDSSITGISSFPLVITGAGTPITISSEIGTAAAETGTGNIVYANGARIGVLTYTPYIDSQGLYVKLDEYPDQSVTLYKDGSYSGLSFGSSQNFYYVSNDCTGNSYVKVLDNYDKEWWSATKTITGPVFHHGNYYTLSSTIYKMPSGYQSYRTYYNTSCVVETVTTKDGYKKATFSTQPNIPVFTPPITVEGWSEDTTYTTLPDAQ